MEVGEQVEVGVGEQVEVGVGEQVEEGWVNRWRWGGWGR